MSSATQRPSLSPESPSVVFLDHAAGSPLRPSVADAMARALVGLPPNPSGAHRLARATRGVLEDAREQIATSLGVDAREVVFTGGGTESCNLGILGVAAPTAICISAVEHVAVKEAAARAAQMHSVELIELPVDARGVLRIDQAVELIPDGALVSVMAANNETGVIQPIAELRKALRHAPRNVIIHCDAIGASASMELRSVVEAADLISLAGHKLGGPPSCGVLLVREGVAMVARVVGGGQELERRSGTQDVAGIVGMATALSATDEERERGDLETMRIRRDRLAETIQRAHPEITVHGQDATRLPGHLHFSVPGVVSEELILLLDQRGICASAGAACSSGAPQASHVLLAMGVNERMARGALRLTLATSTTDEELDRAAMSVIYVISQLRA